ncbi:MAG: hypothetical protein EOP48_29915 [Sphingobacteriales bacterium]|nr:MAG: hypothetical protein EOP48_29915 [Sphingobacteriales bacterium]
MLIGFQSQIITAQTQDPENEFYVGTWKCHSGNDIFRLFISEDTQPNPSDGKYYLMGHYTMSHLINNVETLTYTSKPANQAHMNSAFSGAYNYPIGVSGLFREIHSGSSGLGGNFLITPEPLCSGCQVKIHWTLNKTSGVRFDTPNTSPDIVVPLDIILTKE